MNKAEYVFTKLAQKAFADKNPMGNIDPSKYPSTAAAAEELSKNTSIPVGRGLGAYNPDNTKPNYLISYLSKGNNDRVNNFDIYSSNKSVPGFNPEWQKRIDIGNLSNQVMKTPSEDFPNYKSVGAGWKDNMKLYELAKEHGISYNPPIAYNVGKNRYLGLGAFVPPVQEPIPDRKELLDYKNLPTNLGNLGKLNVDVKPVHAVPRDEPFCFASNVPWLGILGGYLGGRWSAKGGEGLHSLKDANWWTRATHLRGERFGGQRPLSTTVGAITGFGLGTGLDYALPWVSNKLFGTNYPTGTPFSNVIGDQIYNAGKWGINQVGEGAKWLGNKISNIFK